MKCDWVEIIAAEMHEIWMELLVEAVGREKAREHKHFIEWGPELQSAADGPEAMNQDRFVAASIVRAYCKSVILQQSDLPAFIHNSVQLWIRLTGEELKPWHVPYLQSTDTAINARMEKERTTQAKRVWLILQRISNIDEIRSFSWIQ
jgi:hypothetical protein